ncbi:phage integrase, putative [Leptolyngbya sp. NIES-3755]|nr:phage integrase, putative [Leptolyngbya sp. NIES-3755]
MYSENKSVNCGRVTENCTQIILVYSKGQKGKVGIEARGSGIRFNLPRSWFPERKDQIRFALGLPNTEENWTLAELIASDMNRDFAKGRLPESIEGIKAKYLPKSHLTVVETIVPKNQVSLTELCRQYFEYRKPGKSPKTIHTVYDAALRILEKCPTDGLEDPLKFRMELMQVTTEDSVRRTLMQISAACKWGMKHKLCSENPFDGMYKEFEISKSPPPVAFSVEERDRIIAAFKDHKGNWNGRTLRFKEVENWHEPIKMTPYNCRDTFITLQAEQGIGTDVIARWVGNSAAIIEKKYLDKKKLDHLKPRDI